MDIVAFINRIRGILSEPKKEFQKIKDEQKLPKKILVDFILVLVVVNALSSFLGEIIFGPASFKVGSGIVIQNVIFIAVVQVVAIYLTAYLVNELLPFFHLQKNFANGFKVIAYSYTPIFLTNIFAGLLPNFSNLINFFGFYSLVILWIGIDALIPQNKERKIVFMAVVIALTGLIYLAIHGMLGWLFT